MTTNSRTSGCPRMIGWGAAVLVLRSPANARRLMEAVAWDKSRQATFVKTMEEALAGE